MWCRVGRKLTIWSSSHQSDHFDILILSFWHLEEILTASVKFWQRLLTCACSYKAFPMWEPEPSTSSQEHDWLIYATEQVLELKARRSGCRRRVSSVWG